MSNYQELGGFDIYWVKELIFVQIRNNLIFIKNSPWTPMSHLSPVWVGSSNSNITNVKYR